MRSTEANNEIIGVLEELWPKCFQAYQYRRRPLKVGIHKEILATGIVTLGELSSALRAYTWNPRYLKAMRAGAGRVGLDGELAGTVTERDEVQAKETLECIAQKRARRRAEQERQREAKMAEIKKDLKGHIRAQLLKRKIEPTETARI